MKISIITVCFNSEASIARTLQSINDQSYQNFEVIIVDGSSRDATLEVVKVHSDSRYTIVSEKDNGIYHAMNKGILLATGDIIHFLNSDDFFADSMVLENVVNCFLKNQANIVYGDIAFINTAGDTISIWKSEEFEAGMLENGFHIPHPGFFAKKQLFVDCGMFNTSFQIAADYDLISRFLLHDKASIHYLSSVLVHMGVNGKSSKYLSIIKGFFELRNSQKNLQIHINLFRFIINRYFPKIVRKIKSGRLVLWLKKQ